MPSVREGGFAKDLRGVRLMARPIPLEYQNSVRFRDSLPRLLRLSLTGKTYRSGR